MLLNVESFKALGPAMCYRVTSVLCVDADGAGFLHSHISYLSEYFLANSDCACIPMVNSSDTDGKGMLCG